MRIESINLHLIEQKLKAPFSSSIETVENRESIIVEVIDENGETGWGEVVAFSSPWYTEETVITCLHILSDFLIPIVLRSMITHPNEVGLLFQSIRRNNMAKAGIETAIWDLYSKTRGQSLSKVIGGVRARIDSGVVVGLNEKAQMLQNIEKAVIAGYKRVKIKIKPGQDYEVIRDIRREFPDLPLMVDANSSYSLENTKDLRRLDEFNLMMIEQPLGVDDIIDHAILQNEINTPICLDESIISLEDAKKAIQLGSCKVINIKIGRVGGLWEAIKIHNYCKSQEIPVWCGGMLEMGISRAHNIALASLENFSIPGDISATSKYWERDIVYPEVIVNNGLIAVPDGPGIGFSIDRGYLESIRKKEYSFNK